ncbi:transient receptor potential cation channel subfamily M member 4-like [Babylonia areolata]|uniref:transient receptor potential cation channel subfamily M member 4-like n=1 Tax=Babylonia areolata TaxID=304850 RepID=UPI003FD5C867
MSKGRCGLKVFQCGLKVFQCGLKVFQCGLKVFQCGLKVFRCGLKVFQCLIPDHVIESRAVPGSRAMPTMSRAQQELAIEEPFGQPMVRHARHIRMVALKTSGADGMGSTSAADETEAEGIRRRIQKRTCSTFISTSLDDGCQCGRGRERHRDVDWSCAGQAAAVWSSQLHTVTQLCDDYGTLCFRGYNCFPREAKFSRVDHAADMGTVWSLLTHPQLWRLSSPALLLSLLGGHSPVLSPGLQDSLKRVFTLLSVSTGAWLVTDGSDGWLNALVAQGIEEERQRAEWEDYDPVVLGIGHWGTLANSQALEGAGRVVVPAKYCCSEAKEAKGRDLSRVGLDHRHTHFLLVDDGTEGQGGSHAASSFRANLEQHLLNLSDSPARRRGSVMTVVVSGGLTTLQEVCHALSRDRAVLVLTPTGGAADLIQHVTSG